MRRWLLALLALVIVAPAVAQPACELPARVEARDLTCRDEDARQGHKGQFDHYVLMLSWSPEHCASPVGASGDSAFQCRRTDPFGWVVHGLWPQNRDGADPPWPQFCGGRETIDAATVRQSLCTVPSQRLITCQWRKHGSCSDFTSPARYFEAIRTVRDRVRTPDLALGRPMARAAVLDAWVRANPDLDLTRDAVALRCERDRLEEVAICLNRTLTRSVACGRSLRRCPDQLTLRPIAPR